MLAGVVEEHLQDEVQLALHRPGMPVGVEERPEGGAGQALLEGDQLRPGAVDGDPIVLLAEQCVVRLGVSAGHDELLDQLVEKVRQAVVAGPVAELAQGALVVTDGPVAPVVGPGLVDDVVLQLKVGDGLTQLLQDDRVDRQLEGPEQLGGRELPRLKVGVVAETVGDGVGQLSVLTGRVEDDRRLVLLLKLAQQGQGGGGLATPRLADDQEMVGEKRVGQLRLLAGAQRRWILDG